MLRDSRKKLVSLVLALVLLMIPAASQAQTVVVSVTSATTAQDYVVQSGDWLARIAREKLGDWRLYPAIVVATNAMAESDASYAGISNPMHIEPSWKLRIPSLEAAQGGLTWTKLANASYASEWLPSGLITLEDGAFSQAIAPGSASKLTAQLLDPLAVGLTPEGEPFAAVLLVTSGGGSGSFVELDVMVQRDGELVQVGRADLGDRVQIRSLSVLGAQITLDVVRHGPNDPMCCPTERATLRYAVVEGVLVELLPGEMTETVWEWRGSVDAAGQVTAIGTPERYTLLLNEDGTYNLQADCNRLFGAWELVDGKLILQPGGSTRALCGPDSLDTEFLAGLAEIGAYMVGDGQLTLVLNEGGGMVFEPANVQEHDDDDLLLGFTWEWQQLVGSEDESLQVVAPWRYTLVFQEGGTYAVQADCNRSAGGYAVEGASLSLLPGPTTLAECGPDSLYDDYLQYLGAVERWALVDGQLHLQLESEGPVMVFGQPEPLPTGVTWQWAKTQPEGACPMPVENPEKYDLVLSDDGNYYAQADCNQVKGQYTVDGHDLTIEPGASTRARCAEGSRATEYVDSLEDVVSWRMWGGNLELKLSTGEWLVFVREEAE